VRPSQLSARLSAADEAAHRSFVESLGDSAIWRRYFADGTG
jgi:DNA polymerase-3 subunit epsilon